MRLDLIVAGRIDASREIAKRMIARGGVLVKGVPVLKPSAVAEDGDVEIIAEVPQKTTSLRASDLPLDVIFENEHLLVINKQAGVSTHPAGMEGEDTIANAVVGRGESSALGGALRPGIVHRLDKETTGLLIIAKNDVAHAKISSLIAERKIERKYLALCYGAPRLAQFQVKTKIERDAKNRLKMRVASEGSAAREAVTNVLLREKLMEGSFSLLEFKLETGRTHQIRLHAAHIGLPIVGEPVYGSKPPSFFNRFPAELRGVLAGTHRQMLHAYRLFIPEITGILPQEIELEAVLPEDFSVVLKAISRQG